MRLTRDNEPGKRAPGLRHGERAFTMVEIALALAVIGFALVAIIGILPTGMQVQRDNREETVVNQDATFWLEAIRSGSYGVNDLTNYVDAITNYQTLYDRNTNVVDQFVYGYTRTNSSPLTSYVLTNGQRIIGLLSAPKYQSVGGGFLSNNVNAYVRSFSGSAAEKGTNMQDFAFAYRMTTEIIPVASFDTNSTNFTIFIPGSPEYVARSNAFRLASTMEANLHDVRLTMRWPILPNGRAGSGRLVYRTTVGGRLVQESLPVAFHFEPNTYVRSP